MLNGVCYGNRNQARHDDVKTPKEIVCLIREEAAAAFSICGG
jgi:hypothetical protein